MYLVLFFKRGIAISCIEGIPILDCLFETASAIGTGGADPWNHNRIEPYLKIYPDCPNVLGIVVGLTLVFAAISSRHLDVSKFPWRKLQWGSEVGEKYANMEAIKERSRSTKGDFETRLYQEEGEK